jgi:hypothetical protein
MTLLPDKWDEMLPMALLACRWRKNAKHGSSPFELLFGYGFDLEGLRTPVNRSAARRRAKEYWDTAANQRKQKVLRSLDHESSVLPIGQIVYITNELKRKLQDRWLGPFLIVQTLDFDTYRLYDLESNRLMDTPIHRSRLKVAMLVGEETVDQTSQSEGML